MDFKTIIIYILIVYIVYYVICILYDLVMKKSNIENNEEQYVVNFDDVEESTPVQVEDDIIHPIKKQRYTNKPINTEIEIKEEKEDQIEMDVEGQGIPFDILLQEGKQLFSNVNY